MKAIAVMQPYFLPYIGYFQLINAVDEFIIYDNIQFSKRGWFHRNRILQNGNDVLITLPIKKDSNLLHVNQRVLAESFHKDSKKLLSKVENSYQKAPYFKEIMPLIKKVLNYGEDNLFDYVYHSIVEICDLLGITTKFTVSSTLQIDHSLKSAEKVIALVKMTGGSLYINSIGGVNLYDVDTFNTEGIDLKFLKTNSIEYSQFSNKFIPFLSIVDVLMFNKIDIVREYLDQYSLL